MRKIMMLYVFCLNLVFANSAFALLSLELTHGVAGALPIAIVPFAQTTASGVEVADIISNDLQNSGRFHVYGRDKLTHFPSQARDVHASDFKNLGVNQLVVGQVRALSSGSYEVSFQLLDIYSAKEIAKSVVLSKKFVVSSNQLRSVAHRISDLVYEHLLGVKGIFSTHLAYVVVQHPANGRTKYSLEVSDVDGYNPQPLLISPDPIMSPAWAPNGRQIAYVSFEKRRAAIYIEEVSTGSRRLVSNFVGINGAPAWSPDGKKLALVLSKDGTPNIYILSLATGALTPVTHDWSINTEPAWSPDGQHIIFTSNRGGAPQIYQYSLTQGGVSRVTYDGDYNARASYTPDGNHIVTLHRDAGIFNIAIFDLDTGHTRVLTTSGSDNDSPSVAPNGSMVLYGTYYQGRSVLAMVSTDGSVQLRLPGREGNVQDPAWSPY